MVVGFTDSLGNHMLPGKHLTALSHLLIIVKPHSIPSSHSIPMAFFVDNKARYGVLILREGKDTAHILPNPNSVQLGELFGLLKSFESCQQEPGNIFSDSQYAVQAVSNLSFSYIKEQNSPVHVCV